MKRKSFLYLALLCICPFANSQTNSDSLYILWHDAQIVDSVRAGSLRNYYKSLEWGTDSQLSLIYTYKDFSARHGLTSHLGNAYYDLAQFYKQEDKFNAVKYFDSSGMIFSTMKADTSVISGLSRVAWGMYDLNVLGLALKYCEQVLEAIDRTGIEQELGRMSELNAWLLGNVDTETRIRALKKAARDYEKIDAKADQSRIFTMLGDVYRYSSQLDSAEYYYKAHYDINLQLDRAEGIASYFYKSSILSNLKGNRDKTLELIDKAIEIARSKQVIYLDIFLAQKGVYLLKYGKSLEAIANCKESLQFAESLNHRKETRRACDCLYKGYEKIRDYANALYYYKKYNEFLDYQENMNLEKTRAEIKLKNELTLDSLNDLRKKEQEAYLHMEAIRNVRRTRNGALGSVVVILLISFGLFRRNRFIRHSKNILEQEKQRSENLLLNILPAEIATELKEHGEASARDFEQVSILFTDFKQFTELSEKLNAKELVSELNYCFTAFDDICEKHGIEKIKTIGDSYMAAGGLPVPKDNSAHRLTLAALEMTEFVLNRQKEREAEGQICFEMRAGIHTGNVVAGIVGVKKFQYDIWGDTVNTASRMESSSEVGKVNISQDTYELIKDDPLFSFEHRGKVEAKGKGEVDMYFVSLKEL